jgi:hypothetical protein
MPHALPNSSLRGDGVGNQKKCIIQRMVLIRQGEGPKGLGNLAVILKKIYWDRPG